MSDTKRSPLAPVRGFVNSRYGLLLASLTGVAAFGPPLAETVRGELMVVALFAVLVFSAAVAVGHDPATRRRLLAAAAAVLVSDLALGLAPSHPLIVSVGAGSDHAHGRYPVLVYYSFVTLSTVGFGDITPTWSLARSLSTTEAVIGQLYLAILVASLVGMRLAAKETRAKTPDPEGRQTEAT